MSKETEDMIFLGHPVGFWLKLRETSDSLNVTDFIQEIADLRAKVSFYESRIDQMTMFKNRKNL